MSENTNSVKGQVQQRPDQRLVVEEKNHGSKRKREQLEQVQLDHPFGKVVNYSMVQNQKIINMICQKK